MLMRLDKYLSYCDAGSRSEVKKIISAGRVSVNGFIQKDPAFSVDTVRNFVEVDGQPASFRRFVYLMMNKPEGYLSATTDDRQPTVMDLLPEWCRKRGVAPVGRLDKDTTGLLLLTDDGGVNHDLTSPRRHVDKVYLAVVDSAITQEDIDAFAQGMRFSDFVAELAVLRQIRSMGQGCFLAEVTLHEGKYHQVKRMFAARGKHVLELQRVAMGPVELDPSLGPGDWRELTLWEMQALNIRNPNL